MDDDRKFTIIMSIIIIVPIFFISFFTIKNIYPKDNISPPKFSILSDSYTEI